MNTLTKKTTLLALVAVLATAGLASAAVHYEVIITDEILGGPDTGQPFAPPIIVVHGMGYDLFTPGEMATAGLAHLAREGSPAMLADEANGSADVHLVQVGSGPYFDAQVLSFEAEPGQLFSTAWMLGRTNDLFSGLRGVVLPEAGEMLEFTTGVWDAGAEVNSGMAADIPFYGGSGMGLDESAPVMAVTSYSVVDDPNHGLLTWDFPPSGSLTIMATEVVPVEASSLDNIKALYR